MQLFIRGQGQHTLNVTGHESVQEIRCQVATLECVEASDIAMFACGSPLEDQTILSECVGDLQTVDIEVRMLGGKVHGSLARAGKVKGQTPKVEKQEKKKKRTGRAKRRIQYNRRFVNVVASFGRKKGPNSNST